MREAEVIEIYDFNSATLTIHYGYKASTPGPFKMKIIDNKTNFILHQEVLHGSQSQRFWTSVGEYKSFVSDAVTVMFEVEGHTILAQQYGVNAPPPSHALCDFRCEQDLDVSSYYEVFCEQVYARYGVAIEAQDLVVDIGSNQGAFIKYALSHNAATIISCEPNPHCVATIHKYYGHHPNLHVHPYAIAAQNGTTLLQIGRHSDKTGGGKIIEATANAPEYYAEGKTIVVETITFQDFLQKNQIAYIDFLKVDCEGSEVFIFIDANTPFFRTQVHKIALEFHNDQKDEIITFLRAAGYAVWVEQGEHQLGMLYAKNPQFTKGLVASAAQAP